MPIVSTGQITIADVNDGVGLVVLATAPGFTFVDGMAMPASQWIGFTVQRQGPVAGGAVWYTSNGAALVTDAGQVSALSMSLGLYGAGDGNTAFMHVSQVASDEPVTITAVVGEVSATAQVTRLHRSTAAAGATKNTTTYAALAPASPTDGDIWVDTSVTPSTTRLRVSGSWQVAANNTTNTNQLTDGAGLGTTANWSSVSGIPYDKIMSNDAATTLGLNPSFEMWTGSVPDSWVSWGSTPSKETSIVRFGSNSVKCVGTGASSGPGLYSLISFPTAPLPAGTFLSGTIDINITARTAGLPGILVRLFTNSGLTTYVDSKVQPENLLGAWQRVPFTARVGSGQRIYGISIYIMGSWSGFASGVFTGTCYFDGLTFALFDSSVDNTSLTIASDGTLSGGGGGQVTIAGLGYTGALNATNNVVSQGTLAARPTGSDGDFYYATDTAVMFQKISGAWVVAANNTSIDASGNIQGVSSGSGSSVANNQDNLIRAPFGGLFIGSGLLEGRIKIKLPQLNPGSLIKIRVEVVEYDLDSTCNLEISGYISLGATPTWSGVTARVIGGSNVEYPVFLGRDADKACIWIGGFDDVWSSPVVRVADVLVGMNGSKALWESGWVVSVDPAPTILTSGTGVNQFSASVIDTLPGADWAKVSGATRPADNATRNDIFYSATAPGSPASGALWMDTSVTPNVLKIRDGSVWRAAANNSTEVGGTGVNHCNSRYTVFNEAVLPPVTFANGTPVIDATVGYFGTKSLKLTPTAADNWCYLSSGGLTYNFTIQPNRKWIVSGYVRCALASKAGTFAMKAGGTYYWISFTSNATPNTWTRYSGVVDLTANNATTALMRVDADGGVGADMWFDGLMIEPMIGNSTAPSPFTAPPNFLETYTGALNATNNTLSQGAFANRPAGTDGDFYYASDTGTMFQKIGGAWVTSANNTSIDANGKIQGVSSGVGQSVANNAGTVVRAPEGGVLNTSTGSLTGRIKIRLPQLWSATMLRFTVEIFEFAAGYSCTLEIGGYNSNSGGWANCTARVVGGSNVEYPVRFGRDADRVCVWVGDVGDTWSYPQVRVRDFFAGYADSDYTLWESGWGISFDTTAITLGAEPLAANRFNVEVLDTLPGADWSKTSGAGKPDNWSTVGPLFSAF